MFDFLFEDENAELTLKYNDLIKQFQAYTQQTKTNNIVKDAQIPTIIPSVIDSNHLDSSLNGQQRVSPIVNVPVPSVNQASSPSSPLTYTDALSAAKSKVDNSLEKAEQVIVEFEKKAVK